LQLFDGVRVRPIFHCFVFLNATLHQQAAEANNEKVFEHLKAIEHQAIIFQQM
jgi:hypothetical protein